MSYLGEIVLKQIIEDYENGTSLKEINKKLHIPIRMIKLDLFEYGGKRGKKILLQELEKEFPMIKEIIEKYDQGKTSKQLSEQYHTHVEKISNAIQQYKMLTGKTLRKNSIRNYRDDLQIDEIIKEFRKGETLSKIASDQKTSVTAVRNRVNKYIQENGNEIVEERKKAIEERNNNRQKAIHNYRDDLQIDKIIEGFRKGKTWSKIAHEQKASDTTIRNRVNKYIEENGNQIVEERKKAIEERKKAKNYGIPYTTGKIKKVCKKGGSYAKIVESNDARNTTTTPIKNDVIDLSMIVKYFSLGFSFRQVKEYAKKRGYEINERDMETAQKIESGEQKVLSGASIAQIIKKYGYSYEKLTKIAEKKGYVVLESRYISAKAKINNRNKEGEEK